MTMSSSETVMEEIAPTGVAEEPSQLSAVFKSLGDATCRVILRTLHDAPAALTTQEVAAVLDIALSSTYRKLNRLLAAGLIKQQDEIDPDGHRRARYRPAVDKIEITFGIGDGTEVTLYEEMEIAALALSPNET